MLTWLSANLATILISAVLLAVVISIIRYLIRQKKQGKSTCGGSCGGAIGDVLAHGCDTLVTADLKYHEFADAPYLGINLIDAGHFQTENPVCARLEALLRGAFPELTVLRSQNHRDETHFL